MDNKSINKEIRKISNFSSLPIAIFFALMGIVQIVYPLFMSWLNKTGISIPKDIQHIIIYTLQYVGVAFSAILIFYRTRKKTTGLTLKNCFKKPEMSAGWIAKWIIIAVAFSYISNFATIIVSSIMSLLFGTEYKPLDFNFGNTDVAHFALVLALSIYAPFFEELLFRGAVYRNNEILGQKFAMIVTGLAFGLWHTNFTQVIYASVIGCFACFLYAKTRSIIPSIILHFIINSITVVMTIFYIPLLGNLTSINLQKEMAVMMENPTSMLIITLLLFSIFVLIITGIVLFIIELVKHRKETTLRKSIFEISTFKKIAVYFTAPITLITFGYMIIMTVVSIF